MRGDRHVRPEDDIISILSFIGVSLREVGLTYDLAAWEETVLLSPEKRHHGNEHSKHDCKNNVSDESERAARVHRGGCADGAYAAAGGEEADGDEDAETHDDADFVGSRVGAVVVEEAVTHSLSLLFF